MKRLLVLCLALACSFCVASGAHAFSGEDPVFGHPWYHEKLTREAAIQAGFSYNKAKTNRLVHEGDGVVTVGEIIGGDPLNVSDEAAEAIAWHADYIDSYLYNPVWWGQGGLDRFKAAKATEAELIKCHFDDLFTTDQVSHMWRRYASGAFAGLMWAKENDDVFAAQNIVGVSLHAMQDFYAHSSWVDKPERRTKTYFEYARAARLAENIYTGAYELDHQLGVKSHGKWIPKDAIWGQPGVKQIMEIACDPLSPFSNSDYCASYKAVKAGTPMMPTVGGVLLPQSIMVYTPAGIALDNTWVANESIKQRGIAADFIHDAKGSAGKKAFDLTYKLALNQSVQWLQTLERAMIKANAGDFWNKVKNTKAGIADRTAQYEHYNQFPYTFMSAGEYPPKNVARADEWFLRVRVKTANDRNSGTDSDIQLRAGGKLFDLDYMPKAFPLLAYNDFEAGDDDIYVVGPFAQCPNSFDLINNSADKSEMLNALGRDFVAGVNQTYKGVGDMLLNVVAGHADKVAVNKTLWMPQDLAAIPATGKAFRIDLNGGKEGIYRVDGTILKVGEDEQNAEFSVRLDKLSCIKESTWDRGSSEDEPFILCALNPFPGGQQSWLSPVFSKVDTGESRDLKHEFGRVRIPKSAGMLNLAITQMESDDEPEASRKQLMQGFAGMLEKNTEEPGRRFLTAAATTVAAEWKVEHLEVTAWSRNGQIRQGKVLNQPVNRWIMPRASETFPLNVAAAQDTGISTDELLPELGQN